MLLGVIGKVSLFHLLYTIDVDLAEGVRAAGCPCGGPLHAAHYGRKPRGGPVEIPDEYCRRMSLCCGREGCRRRALPRSVLFMGRRVYWGAVVLVVTALRQQRATGTSAAKLKRMFGVSHRTLLRWMAYFRDVFPATPRWKQCRGRVGLAVGNRELPASLVTYVVDAAGEAQTGLVTCLSLLAGSTEGCLEGAP